MGSPISDRTAMCLRGFESLDGLLAKSQPNSLSSNSDVLDSATRFRLWAGNLGAYHPLSDRRSADFRLQDAPTILKHLLEVLDELCETIGDIEALLSGRPNDQSVLANDNATSEEGEEKVTSELQELCELLPDIITSLFKVSILVRKDRTRDRYAKAAAATYDPFLLEFDVRHVGDKFPKTRDQPWLQTRLGHAITRRRQYLRYQRDHSEKIAHVRTTLPVPEAQIEGENARTAALSRPSQATGSSQLTFAPTTASTLEEKQAKMAAVSLVDDEFADDRSAATSFVSSKVSDDAQSSKLRVMDLQEVQNNGSEFECPYCRGIVRIKRRHHWKKHVFRDLRAYVCTFPDCSAGLFEDRQSWFRHELECHRLQWICFLCANKHFSSPDDLKRHLKALHQQEHNTHQTMDAILKASARTVQEIAASSCPLCDEWGIEMLAEAQAKGIEVPSADLLMMPLNQFETHLAEHHEQLALFAKPPGWERDVDSEDESQHSSSSGLRIRLALGRGGEDLDEISVSGSKPGARPPLSGSDSRFSKEDRYEHPDGLTSVSDLMEVILYEGSGDDNALEGDTGKTQQATLVETVQRLINAGADVNAQGGGYGNALQAASWRGQERVVKMLIDAGADVNAQGGQYGNALRAASREGHEKVVQILIDAGADVNTKGGASGNALQAASWGGRERVVQILIDAGADVNAQGGTFGTALQAASWWGYEKVVQMLIEVGADINAQGGEYGNALLAASWGGYEDVVRILIDAGVDVNAKGGDRGNALQAALSKGHDKVAQMLRDAGADDNA